MTSFFPRWWHEPNQVVPEDFDDDEDLEGFEWDPNDPDAPCWGRSCIAECCHHDDCFIRRRMVSLPDMRWPEGQEQPPMSEKVRAELEWLESEEGQEAMLFERWKPTGGHETNSPGSIRREGGLPC